MSNELYQRLDSLIQENKDLVIKLHLAESEVASLKLEVTRLKDGQLALTIKLEDATAELGRLRVLVNPPR